MTGIIPTEKTERIYIDSNDVDVIEIDSNEGQSVLNALSSDLTREVFIEIYKNPSTVSDIAEKTDNSIQNIKYHFEKLENADIIQEVGEKYSKKGNKMSIYGPKNESIVFVASKNKNVENNIIRSIKNLVLPFSFLVVLSSIMNYFINSYYKESKKVATSESMNMAEETSNLEPSIITNIIDLFSSSPQISITLITIFIGIFSILIYIIGKKYLFSY